MATPSGSLSLSIQGLVDLVANSAAFQTRGSFANATAAEKSIYIDAIVIEENEQTIADLCPLAIVTEIEHGFGQVAEGDGIHVLPAGGVSLHLIDTARFTSDHKESKFDFTNYVGTIIDQIAAVTGDGGGAVNYFPVRECLLAARSARTPRGKRQTKNDIWESIYSFSWGGLA